MPLEARRLKLALLSYAPSPYTLSTSFLLTASCTRGSVWLPSETASSVTCIDTACLLLASTARCIFRYPRLTFHFFLIQSPEFETLIPEESIATDIGSFVFSPPNFICKLFVLSHIVLQSGAFRPSTYLESDLTNPSSCLKGRWKRTW